MRVKTPVFKIYFRDNAVTIVVGRLALKVHFNVELSRFVNVDNDNDETGAETEGECYLHGPALMQGH